MGALASQITSLTIVFSIVYSDAHQGKHQSSASLAFVRGIHRGPVNSPHKWPVMRKIFPFDDVIMFVSVSLNRYIFSRFKGNVTLHAIFFLWCKFEMSIYMTEHTLNKYQATGRPPVAVMTCMGPLGLSVCLSEYNLALGNHMLPSAN